MALVATWHLSVPVLTCGTEVHHLPLNVRIGRDIWQVAFKSLPLGNTASLTGLLKACTWPASRKRKGERVQQCSLLAQSPHRPPSIYPPLSLEYCAKSALSNHLPLTHQMHARQPLFQTALKNRTTGEVKRKWQSVTTKIATWWPDAAALICPHSLPLFLQLCRNKPKLQAKFPVLSLDQVSSP